MSVVSYDLNEDALRTSGETVRDMLSSLVKNRILKRSVADAALSRIRFTSRLSDVSDAEWVQESVSERLEAKVDVFRKVEGCVSKAAIIATSTSGLPISEIQKHLRYPERTLIAHPLNPPHLVPLVEVVPGDRTSKQAVSSALRFMKAMGREPVLVRKQLPGFAANRIQFAILREVLNLLDEDAVDMEGLEKIFYAGLGLRLATMGQFTTSTLNGGKGGLKAYFDRYEEDIEAYMGSTNAWTSMPESARRKAIAKSRRLSVVKEMGYDEAVRWRDERLIKVMRQLGYLRF